MTGDELWITLREEATHMIEDEPLLASYAYTSILNHDSLGSALSYILAYKIADDVMSAVVWNELIEEVYHQNPMVVRDAACDIQAVSDRDPAILKYLTVIFYLKGFHAIQIHRVAHELYKSGRQDLALLIQSRNSACFGVDIHPAALIGKGVMFDHATGIVIGETAVVEDNVSILQSVTLGGTGNEIGDRHPKVRSGVMIGAGTKVLGNIEIGEGAKVGAGSVVLRDVEPHTTVVGVPAVTIGKPGISNPCETMDQDFYADGDCS